MGGTHSSACSLIRDFASNTPNSTGVQNYHRWSPENAVRGRALRGILQLHVSREPLARRRYF